MNSEGIRDNEPLLDYPLEAYLGNTACPWRIGDVAPYTSSYAELRTAVLQVASGLRALCIEHPGRTHVVVACRELRHFVPALLGAWQQGLTVEFPVNVNEITVRTLRAAPHVLDVLHDTPNEPGQFVPALLDRALVDRALVDNARVNGALQEAPLRRLLADDVLVVLHTSGTTSAPKTLTKCAWQLLGEVEALAQTFAALGAQFLSTVPHYHLYGLLFGVLLPLRLGAAVIDARPLFPKDVAAVASLHHANVLVSTPAHLRAFVNAPMPAELSVISSGAPLSPQVHLELAFRHRWTTWDVLGSTETGGIAMRKSPLASWRPLPGVTLSVADSEVADHGRAIVTSPWAGAVETEDRICLDVDGSFSYLGRADALVKVAGKRIDLAALEIAVRRFAGVEDVAVLAEDDAIRGTRIACVVAPAHLDMRLLRAALAAELDPILVPRSLLAVAALPREASGKLRRAELVAEIQRGAPTNEETGAETTRRVSVAASTRRELAITELAAADTLHRYRVIVPYDYVFFDGHFAGFSVLPAVVQLAKIVAPLARRAWDDLGAVRKLKRARFRHPIFPGQVLDVKLERAAARVSYTIEVDGRTVASGALEFG